MQPDPTLHPRRPGLTRDRLLPPVVAGLVIWVLAVTRGVVTALAENESVAIAVLITLPPVVYWVGLAPVILWLGIRFPLRRGGIARAILVHALAAAVIAAVYAQLMARLLPAWSPEPLAGAASLVSSWPIRFQIGLFSYSFLLSWGYVHEYFTALRQRDVALARLETELAQAQLRALKAQLQPHFLFNTLHAITVLIRHDPDAAGRMVMRLSDLLRMTLEDAERQEVTLEHELRFLRLYLEIEQTRFRDRLEVRWEVSPGLDRAAVPNFLLQPLVENALKHGVGARAGGGRVVVGASRDDGTLLLRVTDDGPGLRGGPADSGRGIGIASTRGRLERLYGDSHRFAIEENPAGGVSVTVGIPYRRLDEVRDG
jgi:signal transduction histidine kinase